MSGQKRAVRRSRAKPSPQDFDAAVHQPIALRKRGRAKGEDLGDGLAESRNLNRFFVFPTESSSARHFTVNSKIAISFMTAIGPGSTSVMAVQRHTLRSPLQLPHTVFRQPQRPWAGH